MQWLSELPFSDNRVLQIAILACSALAVLIVLAIIYRFVFAHRLRVPGGRTRQPRLGLVDAFSLDGQRQLVLIRRDNIEHLVMIGGPNDILVESQINRVLTPAREPNHGTAHPAAPPSAPPRRTEPIAAPPPQLVAAPPQAVLAQPAAPASSPAPPPALKSAPAAPASGASARAPMQPPFAPSSLEPRSVRPAAVPEPAAAGRSSPPSSETVPAAVASPRTTIGPRESVASKPLEPAPSAPTQSPLQPRPLPARPSMPSPIVPSRGGPASAMDRPPAPSPPGRPSEEKGLVPTGLSPVQAEPVAVGKPEKIAPPTANVEARMIPAAPAPRREEAAQDKPAHGRSDPFADLDTLEAEMARLLGRDKLS